jgi:hypothetical protein
MWRRVDIVLTDVSEERIASIFRPEEKRRKSSSEVYLDLLTLVLRLRIFFFFLLPRNGGDTFL